jgi:hypothetical protein
MASALPLAARAADVVGDSLEGSRPFPFDPGAKFKGEQPFRARSGQRYRNIRARNFGNGLIRIADDVDGLTVEDVDAVNYYRLIECDAGRSLTNFTVRRIRATGFERSVARLRGRSSGGLFQDIWADSEAQAGDPFAMGFHLDEACRDITFERCSVFRCQTPAVPGKYRQGDGFTTEAGCSSIRFIDTLAQECTDGGYDMKATALTMVRAKAVRNKRNFRLWADARLDHIVSESPTGAHISTHGAGSRTLRIERLEVRSTTNAPLFLFEAKAGSRISIGSHDIRIPPGARLIQGHGDVDWGAQGPPKA